MRVRALMVAMAVAVALSGAARAGVPFEGEGPAHAPDAGAAATPAPAAAASPAAAPASATAAVTTAPPRTLPPIPAGMGRIAGRVTLAGLAPKLPPVPVGKDMKTCGSSKVDEALEVGAGGGVKNALLWAQDGPPPANGSRPRAKLSLLACQFTPHVVAVPVGGELLVVNEDAVFHNATGSGELTFNYAMPIKGHTIPTKVKKPGIVKVESKSHPWMKAWVHVLPTTASVVTEADGAWYLDLPPGPHQLKLWHERLGEREDKIEIEAGQTAIRDMALTPR